MKAVIDTNVLMSAVFFGGQPGKILSYWQADAFELVVSQAILDEYRWVGNNLQDKFGNLGFDPIFAIVSSKSTLVGAQSLPRQISRDPDGDKFIACAVSASAGYIISGDKDLTDLKSYKKIKIVKPALFTKLLQG